MLFSDLAFILPLTIHILSDHHDGIFALYFAGKIIPVIKIMAYPIFKYLLFLQSSTNTTEIFKPCDIVCYMRYYKGHSMTLGMTLFYSPLPLQTPPPPPVPNSIAILSFHLIVVSLKSSYM